jgi:hypothetical protein
MMRRYLAVGALAAVAVLVAAIVVLIMPQTHEPSPTSSTAASAAPAITVPAPARVSARHASAATHTPARSDAPAAVPVARENSSSTSTTSASTSSVRTGSFTASYPASWRLTSALRHGGRRYQLSSTGAAIGGLGIGPAGTVGVTIDESRPSTRLGAFAHDAARLLPLSVGTPRAALDLARSAPPRTVQLGGEEAAEESYAYTFRGHQNVQSDVLAIHDDRLVLVELAGEPNAARAAQAGFEALMRSWRWR